MSGPFAQFIDELTAPTLAQAKRWEDQLRRFDEEDRAGGILKQIEDGEYAE